MSVNARNRRARYARRIIAAGIAAFGAAHVEKAHGATLPADPHLKQARLASAGDLAAGRVLGGMTAQHWPVIMTLSNDGTRLGAAAALDLHCTTTGDTVTFPDGWVGVRAPASGVVHAVELIPPIAGSANADAITGGMDTLDGKLNRKRATFSGSWELQINFTLPNGQSDPCDSGRVSFKVRL